MKPSRLLLRDLLDQCYETLRAINEVPESGTPLEPILGKIRQALDAEKDEAAHEQLEGMEIADTYTFGNYEILCVPGGWVFTRIVFEADGSTVSSCFVPNTRGRPPRQIKVGSTEPQKD